MPTRNETRVHLWQSLRLRLPLLIALLFVGVLSTYLFFSYREIRADLIDAAGGRAQGAADQIAGLFALSTQQRIDRLARVAADPSVLAFIRQGTAQSRAQVIARFESEAEPAPQRFELWTRDGTRLLDMQVSGTRTNGPEPEIPSGAAPTSVGIKPLRSVDGRLVSSDWVNAVVDSAAADASTPLGFLVYRSTFSVTPPGILRQLVGDDARVAIGNQTDGVWTDLSQVIPPPPVDLAHRGVRRYQSAAGTGYLGAVTPIATTPWAAWVEFPESTIIAPGQQLLKRVGELAIGFLLAGLVLVMIVSTRMTRPLRELSAAAARIGQGDYSARITSNRTDEIGALADSFNTMAAEVRSAYGAIKRSQEHTEFALQSAHMGVWETDLVADRVMWSDSMAQLFGLAREQTPRTRTEFLALVHPDDRSETRERIEGALSEGNERINLDFRWAAGDGTVHWIEANARVLYAPDGRPLSDIGVAIDVTARKTLETQLRQAQKMEAIGQLAGGVAHDFNNLLTAILGYAKLLSDSLPPGDARLRDVDEIHQAAERAAGLTRQLLAFSRQQVLQPTAVDLNSLVTETSHMLRRLIGEHIELVTQLSPDLAPVMADKTQLEQVIMNLAVNARDAMPGGGEMSISTANVELDQTYAAEHAVAVRSGPFVMLAVSDTGVGMNEQTRRRLFEPFFTTKERGKGTGLGLATVYGIVKQSGGYIWVYSEPGRGASFKVYLPQAEKNVEAEPAVAAASPKPAAASETVLVVEDEAAVRFLTRILLERAGYRVIDAPNPQTAETLCTQEVNLLITDVIMPGGTGPELFQTLAVRFPNLKVLYMSGYTDQMVAREGQLDPDTAFLQKPFSSDGLLRKVRDVLDR